MVIYVVFALLSLCVIMNFARLLYVYMFFCKFGVAKKCWLSNQWVFFISILEHLPGGKSSKTEWGNFSKYKLIRYNMKRITIRQIVDIVFLILLLLFIGQNLASVRVRFLFFGFELPLIILIAIVFFVGFYTAKVFKKKSSDRIPEELQESE